MRFALKILACTLVAYALAAYMVIPANPEVNLWQQLNEKRDLEIAAVRSQQPGKPILFFTGGSSCAFSIDPKPIEEQCGMPAFNLGLPVSAGPRYILHQALKKANKGDTIVIALEPDTLTYATDFAPTSLSFGLAIENRDSTGAVGGSTFGRSPSFRNYLNFCRPGPGYTAVWFSKAFTGKGYRYVSENFRYHGRMETPVHEPSLPLAGKKDVKEICESGRTLLKEFKEAGDLKGVHLLYSMPWILNAENAADHNRSANLQILNSISEIIPTIDDGYQGVATDPSCFADSGLHLTEKGSKIRSEALGKALKMRFKVREP